MKSLLILVIIFLLSCSSIAQIIITEIMYNPPESGTDSLEFLELYNHSADAVELEGWSFTKGITMVFNGSAILEPGEYLTLCVNERAFKSVYGETIRAMQWQSRALVNGGELIELSDAEGNVVYAINYFSGSNGWYKESDGNGASIELCDFNADPDQRDSWRPASNSLGIVINQRELFASPGRHNDASCDGAVVVKIEDLTFTPPDITINAGQLVRWENQGGGHNVNGSISIFPENPVSFSSGAAHSGSWIYEFIFDKEGVYHYQSDPHAGQGMQGSVFVGQPDPYLNVTIKDIRENDDKGIPLLSARRVRTSGIVHTPNLRPGALEFFLLDKENNGVSVFHASGNLGYNVREGDEIRVEGILSEFRGLTQILAESITILTVGNTLVSPSMITSLSEASEGSLVKFTGYLLEESMWTNAGSGFNVKFIDNEGNIIDVRIVAATEIFGTPHQVYSSVTGIASQFTPHPPFNTGYQLIPRYLNDLETSAGIRVISTLDFEISPNPVGDQIKIKTELAYFEYLLIDYRGEEIAKGATSSPGVIDVTGVNPGLYILMIKRGSEYGVKKIIIQ